VTVAEPELDFHFQLKRKTCC